MNVTGADLKLIADGCRSLIVGIERGEMGELLPCRYEKGICFTVRAGQRRTDRRRLTTVRADLSRDRTVPDSYIGSIPRHGAVWVVTFVPGNHEASFNKHAERYFSKSGITTNPRRAIHGEPAVTTDEEKALAAKAGQRREMEDEQWLALIADELEQIRRRLPSNESKRLLKRAIRTVVAVPSGDSRILRPPVQQMGAEARTPRPPNAVALPTPDQEAA